MSRCWLEGEWRAYLDRELPPPEMEAAGRHVEDCERCAALVRGLSWRAARVGALMAELEHIPQTASVAPRAVPGWGRRGLAMALVLAAVWAAGLLMFPRKTVERRPAPQPRPQIAAVVPEARAARAMRPEKIEKRKARRPAPSSQMQYYLALDNEPIESGVVVRVALADSGLLADVIYDEQGRPRAVRPLN